MKGICIYGNQVSPQSTQTDNFWGGTREFSQEEMRFYLCRSGEGGNCSVSLATELQESQL